MQQNILICGTGGQGIIAAGGFLSKALFRKDLEVMFSRSYGASARGGACKSEIMVSDKEINDLQFEESDVLLALSLPAFKKYIGGARQGSLVIVDSSVLARVDEPVRGDVKLLKVPARDIAVELGNQIVANMVILGALARVSEMVSLDYLREAVEANMKPGMRAINLQALQRGSDSVE